MLFRSIHDVLRGVIRRTGFHDEASLRDALETVDADEAGFKTLEEYREDQQQKAEAARKEAETPAAAPAPAPDLTPDERAELEQLRAEAAARAAQGGAERPAAPGPVA